jgi:hypothetical protein
MARYPGAEDHAPRALNLPQEGAAAIRAWPDRAGKGTTHGHQNLRWLSPPHSAPAALPAGAEDAAHLRR